MTTTPCKIKKPIFKKQMNISLKINNLIAYNSYSVNGHSPCIPKWRHFIPKVSTQIENNSTKLTTLMSSNILLKSTTARVFKSDDDLGIRFITGVSFNRNTENAILNINQITNKQFKNKNLNNTWPALLHKGRVSFVNYEAHLSVITKFINSLMKGGKQQKAENILRCCRMFTKIKIKKTSKFLYQAIQNVKPLVELKNQQKNKGSRRKQKSTPASISSKRSIKLAIQWIIEGAKKRSERTMALRLYLELLNAYNKKGYAIKKKTDLHNQCQVSFFHSSSPIRTSSSISSSNSYYRGIHKVNEFISK